MNVELDALEARVLGCLIEKSITNPDLYPLSLNALQNACNQKTNREPVLSLDEREVQATIDRLSKRHLLMESSGFGSRVPKYRQRLCNGEHNPRRFSPGELAIVCELLLRGAQTPGELRGRTQRLHAFADVGEVEAALTALAAREDGPYVRKLARAPGAREARWRQLFSAASASDAGPADEPAPTRAAPPHGLEERLAALEDEVARLRAELAALRSGA
jgi:uncharacterized protein